MLFKQSENNIVKIIFKLAVEVSMMMNVVAYDRDISGDQLGRLRHTCIQDVKKTHGTYYCFEDAYRFQNEEQERA